MLLRPRQLLRLAHINFVLVRHGLDELVFAIHLLRPLRFLLLLSPLHWVRDRKLTRGERIRRALEDLGPIFIKFGQMLSTRRDLLPEDIANEFAKLQDSVPPFSGELARQIIERSYRKPLGEVFAHFDETPIASASIAQVHAAELLDGTRVVVKVVRPRIKRTIDSDIDLMYIVAGLANRYWSEARRLRPIEVIAEYEKTINDELDLMREAANATQLRRNFEGSRDLYIPQVYWDFCTREVMVMERIHGIPISHTEELIEHGVNMKRLAERGVEIFFTQVFRHNFFHADMHPGNIFVSEDNPDDPKYLAVDFGIVGTLAAEDQRYLAENFHAFFNRDYRRVAELHVESGWVPADTRVDEFESAIRTVCEPIFQRPLKQISFGHLLLRLFQTARRFNMQVQPQLVLLQKTLLNIEGLGRDLYPDLDLWQTAKPFLERWMDEQVGVRALLNGLKKQLPNILEDLPNMPGLLHDALAQRAAATAQTREVEQLQALREEIRRANHRTALAVSGAGLFISAFVVIASTNLPELFGVPWLGWALGLAGVGVMLLAWRVDR
ncbi:MAG: ubiquinone biosynthesis regulatory protein kinase UbiB [Gammaproteobacteria bacterium]|jgi:ubiquinone biosynthesis protein